MTLCHFLGANLRHFVSKIIVNVHNLFNFLLFHYPFVFDQYILLLNCKQNSSFWLQIVTFT